MMKNVYCKFKKMIQKGWPYLVLMALIQLFLYPVSLGGENFYWRDILSHSYPAKKIFVDSLQSGLFPLWNPYVSTGTPYLADLSNQPLYLFNIIFLFFDGHKAINITILGHYLLSSVFCFLYLRSVTKKILVSLWGAICFPLCGYSLSVSCNLEYLGVVAWLPGIFYGYESFLKSYKSIYLAVASVCLSMLIFSGDPFSYYVTAILLCLYTLFHNDKLNRNVRTPSIRGRKVLALLLVGGLSLVLSAVQLIPSAELAINSARSGGLPYITATEWSFHPLRLLEVLFPFYFGYTLPIPHYWGIFLHGGNNAVPWVESVYVGVFTLFFAILSLRQRGHSIVKFWIVAAIVTFFIALGKFSPLYLLFYKFLPLFDSFRYPEKTYIFTSFALIVLGGIGFKTFLQLPISAIVPQKRFLWISVALVTLILCLHQFLPLNLGQFKYSGVVTIDFITNTITIKILFVVGFFLLLLFAKKYLYLPRYKRLLAASIIFFTVIDLFLASTHSYTTSKVDFIGHQATVNAYIKAQWQYSYPPRVYLSKFLSSSIPIPSCKEGDTACEKDFFPLINVYLLENFVPNRSLLYDIAAVNTVTSLTIKPVNDAARVIFSKDTAKWLENFSVDYLLATPYDVNKYNPYTEKVLDTIYNQLLKPRKLIPRVYFTKRSPVMDDETDVLKYLQSNLPVDHTVTPEVLDYKANTILVKLETLQEGYLVLHDSYYPGWKATVNHVPAEIEPAYGIFRAIKVGAGAHEIRLEYDPWSVKIGLFVSITALILLVGIVKFRRNMFY